MPFKYREFERKLTKSGYRVVHQKGSHVILSDGTNIFPMPNHASKDISPGVERQLLKILDLTINEFRKIK
ncbi:conserved hypothetical protein [Abyssogena phaseoliformis symbiont OG214]|uniref:type II toxin-antitoxin system HicA family toxin n=1 Tax=Abyssogena phaseoliformis symbiont TaxID=596095 RepID=UPI0019163E16|nr:type II toxin-antitoxin system HicA family toxin [Abyssogena phaseoliformis symbiont]BBB22733.1 conserved hypothetical protein [Abyssogena phaseoliformis symbiont OG214]